MLNKRKENDGDSEDSDQKFKFDEITKFSSASLSKYIEGFDNALPIFISVSYFGAFAFSITNMNDGSEVSFNILSSKIFAYFLIGSIIPNVFSKRTFQAIDDT